MYHLRILIKQGLVEKTDDGTYALTAAGRLRADKLQLKNLSMYEQPRVIVLVACWDDTKGLLLFTRRTQPVINMIGFPHVNIRLGKSLTDSAAEDFQELTGLTVQLKRRGEGYITIFKDKEPESYIFFHLLEGSNPTGELNKITETGELAWYNQTSFTGNQFLPSMEELVHLLKQKTDQPFFVERTYML